MDNAKKKEDEDKDQGRDNAAACYDGIVEMLDALKKAEEDGDDEAREEAITAIDEDPLSVEVRKEYIILLSWGGPAARITGELNEHGGPETASLQYQDWFTAWTDYPCDEETLLEYARHFYFEE